MPPTSIRSDLVENVKFKLMGKKVKCTVLGKWVAERMGFRVQLAEFKSQACLC